MAVRSKRLDITAPPAPREEVKNEEETGNTPADLSKSVKIEDAPVEITLKEEKKAEKTEEKPVSEAVGGIFTPSGVPETDNSALEAEIRDILNVQKGKRAVPSLVSFHSARSGADRHVIIDVTDSIIEEAWARYKERKAPFIDEEEFMGILYKILNTDIPRMYRAVAPVRLRK